VTVYLENGGRLEHAQQDFPAARKVMEKCKVMAVTGTSIVSV
jgi:hypothetical protein